jgi:hypothetical protein
MTVILGLLICCLGLYFLNAFFQLARLEKIMTESVTLLERFMITTYSLETKEKPAAGSADAAGATAPPKA